VLFESDSVLLGPRDESVGRTEQPRLKERGKRAAFRTRYMVALHGRGSPSVTACACSLLAIAAHPQSMHSRRSR
jgi:hypothetical protein